MRQPILVAMVVTLAAATVPLLGRQQAAPTFDAVSIKLNTTGLGGAPAQLRPDGGFRMINIPVTVLISRAYPPSTPGEMVGLPDWTRSERYDVFATSTLQHATADDEIAMLRAMLADRFKLAVHVEKRPSDVYELVLARNDGKLGPSLVPLNTDCDAQKAANAGALPSPPQAPNFDAPPPPCTLRLVNTRAGEARIEGDTTLESLTQLLRSATRRLVVDKTGLPGYYKVNVKFDMQASRFGPDAAPAGDNALPSVFTAVQEQLGLKLKAAHEEQDTLVIDRIDRPEPN